MAAVPSTATISCFSAITGPEKESSEASRMDENVCEIVSKNQKVLDMEIQTLNQFTKWKKRKKKKEEGLGNFIKYAQGTLMSKYAREKSF